MFHAKAVRSALDVTIVRSGEKMSPTREFTIAVKALPTIRPIAISNMLPFEINSLNSFIIFLHKSISPILRYFLHQVLFLVSKIYA